MSAKTYKMTAQPAFSTRGLHFSRWDIAIALAIVFLAFAYRVVIILDRAAAPSETSAFAPLPEGSDQSVYYAHIAQFREGTFPPPQYYYQPGISYFLIGASSFLRTDNLGVLRLFVAWLASVNCGLMIATVRLAFNDRWIAVLAGLLLAVYPVGAFFDTDFVVASQASVLVSVVLFGIYWLWRSPHNWTGALLAGLGFGALAITRFELIALFPVFAGWLLYQHPHRRTVLQLALVLLVGVGVVMPIVLHNIRGSADYLIAPSGSGAMYHGNNRDSDGTANESPALEAVGSTFVESLWHDIQLSPRRYAELVMRKVGLYFSEDEGGNNLSYFISGASVSPALRLNPLNFPLLSALFLGGLFLSPPEARRSLFLLGLACLTMMASTLAAFVEARLRTPVIVALIPVAACGLVYLIRFFPLRLAPKPRIDPAAARLYLRSIVGVVLILAIARYAERNLPRQVIVDELPASAQMQDAVYNDTLRLVGWQVEEQYTPAGMIQPFRPYVVTLYWQVLGPSSSNYSASLAYVIDGQRVVGVDRPIGTVSYPRIPTSKWQPGEIHVEHMALTWKRFDGPTHISGDLLLTVYRERDTTSVLTPRGSSEPFIRLTRPALIWGEGSYGALTGERQAVPFGNALILTDMDLPGMAEAGASVPIRLAWRTTDQQIRDSYSIGVSIFDATGEFLTNFDSPPRGGRLLTSSLPVNFRFEDVRQIVAPEAPGVYDLYVAVYSLSTMERLPVPDRPDGLHLIGSLRIG